MRPKKKLIERARENGSIDRLNKLLSAAHILICEANNLYEEAADLMLKNGLLLGELKQKYTLYTCSADTYFREFATMIKTEKSKMDMFGDLDSFEAYFRKWAKLDKEWKPRKEEAV